MPLSAVMSAFGPKRTSVVAMPLTPSAIGEAVSRANMRFVATKTPEQQSGLMLHRTRHLFIRQQTAVINAIRLGFQDGEGWVG